MALGIYAVRVGPAAPLAAQLIINLIGSRFEMNHDGRQKHSIKWQVSARPAQCLYTALCTAPQLACVDFGSTRFHSNTLSLFA